MLDTGFKERYASKPASSGTSARQNATVMVTVAALFLTAGTGGNATTQGPDFDPGPMRDQRQSILAPAHHEPTPSYRL